MRLFRNNNDLRSHFQTTNNKLIGAFFRELDIDLSCPHKSGALPSSKCKLRVRVKFAIVSRTFLNRKFAAIDFNSPAIISFLLYVATFPSFVCEID